MISAIVLKNSLFLLLSYFFQHKEVYGYYFLERVYSKGAWNLVFSSSFKTKLNPLSHNIGESMQRINWKTLFGYLEDSKIKKMDCHILDTCESGNILFLILPKNYKLSSFSSKSHVLLDTEKEFLNQNKQQAQKPDSCHSVTGPRSQVCQRTIAAQFSRSSSVQSFVLFYSLTNPT